jgi:hypothetical protein
VTATHCPLALCCLGGPAPVSIASTPLNREISKPMPQQELPDIASNGKAPKDRVFNSAYDLPASLLVDSAALRKSCHTHSGPMALQGAFRSTAKPFLANACRTERAARGTGARSCAPAWGITDSPAAWTAPVQTGTRLLTSPCPALALETSIGLAKGGAKDTEFVADAISRQGRL